MERITIVALLLTLFACSPTPDPASSASDRSDERVRYLALGDSYTIGEAVPQKMSFPVQLANLMRTRSVDTAPPVIIAETGWTTSELAAAVESADLPVPFDLVTLLIGVNDQYQGRGVAEFSEGLRTVLEQAIAAAGGEPSRVIVISIPDWSTTPFAEGSDRAAIASEIDDFNSAVRKMAEGAGARWIEITEMSRELSRHESMLAEDGLHPAGMMYAEWARRILPHALAVAREDEAAPH